MDCKADIAAQSAIYPTYKKMDCTLHTLANDVGGIKTYSFVGGTGYVALQVLTVVQTGASGGTFRIDTVDGGVIQTMTRLDKGINYTVANNLATTVNTGGGTDATISVLTIDTGFYGKLIDCTLSIIRSLADACTSWNQGIKLAVTINNEDVTSALIGNINITHNKNMASTFSFTLGDSQYSPHTNSDIGLSKEVVITAYIDGFEQKLITGIIDDINMDYTPEISINISGMDYGKKLLDKRTTIVSVQDLADTTLLPGSTGAVVLRSSIIEYLAEQAGVTSVDIPLMDTVDIDNSFSDQTVWDMIQKEAVINLYWIRFNEEGVMELKLDEVKTDTTTYPTADWTYGENRFTFLGVRKNESDIINKVIVLGTIYHRRIPHITTEMTNPGVDYTTPVTLFSDSLSYAEGEVINYYPYYNYTKKVGEFVLKIYSYGFSMAGGNIHIIVGCEDHETWESYIITAKTGTIGGNASIIKINDSISVGGGVGLKGIMWVISRNGTGTNFENGSEGKAFTFDVTVTGYKNRESTPATYETTTTYETIYNQISASVSDPASINKYGERRPLGQESIEFPLIETQTQCKEIGKKIIRDGHRSITQPNFEVPFNPLLFTGQTIEITDKKIGFSAERWHVESVSHNIEANPVKGRTQVGCVYYAST